MRLKAVDIRPRHDRTELVISASPAEALNIQSMVSALGTIDEAQDYTVTVEKKKKRRSNDANAYLWTLIGKLAAALDLPRTEVYKQLVREYGETTPTPIREDAVDFWIRQWTDRGIGWQCEDLGPCRNIPGYRTILNFYGSSEYDTKAMSRLIDGLIQECKEQGIETLTPDELKRMYKEETK